MRVQVTEGEFKSYKTSLTTPYFCLPIQSHELLPVSVVFFKTTTVPELLSILMLLLNIFDNSCLISI